MFLEWSSSWVKTKISTNCQPSPPKMHDLVIMYHNIGLKNPLVTKLTKLVMTMIHFHFFSLSTHTLPFSSFLVKLYLFVSKSWLSPYLHLFLLFYFIVCLVFFKFIFMKHFFLENIHISYVFEWLFCLS